MYRKPNRGRNGGEVSRAKRVILYLRFAEPDERRMHLCSMTNAF
jgi:hypothetical protein